MLQVHVHINLSKRGRKLCVYSSVYINSCRAESAKSMAHSYLDGRAKTLPAVFPQHERLVFSLDVNTDLAVPGFCSHINPDTKLG